MRYAPSPQASEGPALWQRAIGESDPPSFHALHAVEDGFMLKVRCQGSGSFVFRGEELLIDWKPGGTGPAYYLFGLGLALWLERRGFPCLHANAVASAGRAVGLIGESHAGKTTLTVALLRRGFSLLSDDLLALSERRERFWAMPGLSKMRMWPDTITGLMPVASVASLQRVHAGFEKRWVPAQRISPRAVTNKARPLTALYLLEHDLTGSRRDVVLEPVPPGEALVSLLTHSAIGDAATALGVEERRLEGLARLVEKVPVRRLRYPHGLEWLPHMTEVLAADLQPRSIRTACSSRPVAPYR